MRKRIIRYKRKYVLAQRAQARKLRRLQAKQTRRFNRFRRHPFLTPVLLFLILMAGFIAFVALEHGKSLNPIDARIVIISHDGQKETVPSKEPTVGALLTKLNIVINKGDVVEPALSTPITQDDFRINIYRAQPVEIVEGSTHTFTYSAATTPRGIVQQAGIAVYPEDYINVVPTQNFLADQAIGERVVINPATPVNFNIYGTQTVIRTHATTVGQLLSQEHIVLGNGDSVTPADSTPLSATTGVFLIHSGTKIQSVQQAIPMPIQTVEDNSLAYGTSAIVQQGSNGQEILTYQDNLQNGVVVSQTLLQTVVTVQPVTEIVDQGTNLSGIKGDMALAGIAPEDYQYADYIISNESGWCTTKAQGEHYCPAIPDDSNTPYGYGLCQATPGYKMASAGADWATNPITQLDWCNGYANSKYGGWYNAYLHWESYRSW